MEKINQSYKLSPKQHTIIYTIKDILRTANVDKNNIYIDDYEIFSFINKNLEKILKIDNYSITRFEFFSKELVVIDLGNDEYVKIIYNGGMKEKYSYKLLNLFKN